MRGRAATPCGSRGPREPGDLPGPETGRPSPPAMGADYSIRFERRPADTGPPAAGPCCMLTAKTPLKALMGLTSRRFAVLFGMPFGTHSVRLVLCAALALVPAAPGLSLAAVLPEASADVPAGNHASRPSTDVPGPPLPLPVTAPLRFTPAPGL